MIKLNNRRGLTINLHRTVNTGYLSTNFSIFVTIVKIKVMK